MTTFLLTWNPDTAFKWDDIGELADRTKAGESVDGDWSFGNRVNAEVGDRFFLIKLGSTTPKGIVASGKLTSEPYEADHWADSSRTANYVDVEFDNILDPAQDTILERGLLNGPEFLAMHWDAQSSGTRIPDHVAAELEELWAEILAENGMGRGQERAQSGDRIPQGITREHLLTAIERLQAGFKHRFARSIAYDVYYDGRRYAPKAVVGIAAEIVSRREFGPYDFKGGRNSKCFKILKQCGFEIIPKTELLDYVDADLSDDLSQLETATIKVTERMQLCKARIGQGLFRENLERVEKACRVTGVSDSRVLNASHIKPWRSSTNAERLDGNNGLLLSVHIDRLFDRGLISFSGDGRLLVKDKSVANILERWSIARSLNVGVFNERQRAFLEHHRKQNGFT